MECSSSSRSSENASGGMSSVVGFCLIGRLTPDLV